MKLTLPKFSLKVPSLRIRPSLGNYSSLIRNLVPGRLSRKSGKPKLGVHITDRILRFLEIDTENKPLFEPVEVLLDGKDKQAVIRDIVAKNGLAGKETVACIGVNDGLMKFYKYPSAMSKKDLQSAIEWSIRREIAAMKEETYYDYYILDAKPEDKQIGVVLVLSRKDTVESTKSMLESAGLKLIVLDYEVTTIINYGLFYKLPMPFSILYVDYHYSILTTFSQANLTYYLTYWSFIEYLHNRDEESLESFFAEIRNIVILNDLSSMYVAGPILNEEEMLTRIMENLPVLGLLDLEAVSPNFFVPYVLCLRGVEV